MGAKVGALGGEKACALLGALVWCCARVLDAPSPARLRECTSYFKRVSCVPLRFVSKYASQVYFL